MTDITLISQPRWALFYLSALLNTIATTCIGIWFGFFGQALDETIWPDILIETEIAGLLIIALYVLLTSPIAFVFLLALYPVRRYVFGAQPRLTRVFILVLFPMTALFFGVLSRGYNPSIMEDLPDLIPGIVIAALGYTLVLWLLFTSLKHLFPAKPPQPIAKVFE